ncbi:MAG: tetratricopeptide repeat protein [Bacteroidota bacterium]
MKQIIKLFLCIVVLAMVAGCTTQKKRSDQSALSKAWHNMNAHYNGYFNAREIVDFAMIELAEQHQDNYLELLEVYPYTVADNPQAVADRLDEAMKKVTVVMSIHPYSQWADDCYLLAGQALYLKQDYESAEKAFRFLLNEYPLESEAEKDIKKGKAPKDNKGKRSSSKSSRSNDKEDNADPILTKREREKARKQYNKEVKRRKKQRERSKSSRKKEAPKPEATTPEPTPTPTPRATESEEPAAEEPIGMVRLGVDDALDVDYDKDGNPLKHRPAYQEGQLWMARTFIERDNYEDARRLLAQLENSPATYSDVLREVAVAQAHLAIQQENYDQAATALTKAVDAANKRDDKVRYSFIQGQLYQQIGRPAEALAAYERVVKLKPDYEMNFAAQLNVAQLPYWSKQGTATETIAALEKLLDNPNNEPYVDQVYYAMGTVSLAEDQQAEGVAYLEQCLASPSSNQAQQLEAYYTLGSLFYAEQDYLQAKNYFDSALSIMSKNDERYDPTEKLRNSLVDIANNLEIIALQDSLLRVSERSPEEQAELAMQIYRNRKKPGGAANSPNSKFGNPLQELRSGGVRPGAGPSLRKPSKFFAYDEQTMRRGARDFKRRWGERELADNWRRSNSNDNYFDSDVVEEETELNILTQEQIDKYLADVPKTDGDKEGARLKIKKAMFELGRLYRDRLENYGKSAEILTDLDKKYPGNLHELDSWYYLYLDHGDLNNGSKAEQYKQKILQKYPSSNYGQIIKNPNYAQEYMDGERKLDRAYDETYSLFEAGQYQAAYSQAQQNISRLVGKHPLKARYALLMAMSSGSTQGRDTYVAELQKVIASYPNTPEETRAKEILRLLGAAGASLPGGADEEGGSFKTGDTELHYVIVVFQSQDIDLNANKIVVSDYNRTYHSLDKLRISNVYLGQSNDVPVLVLRRFKDKNKAMSYYNGIQNNIDDFINPDTSPYQVFPITQSNYREILRNRSVAGYGDFFRENY